MARASRGRMTSPALSQGILGLIMLRESTEPLPPILVGVSVPAPRHVDWLLEAKPETPENAMLNGISCTDSRQPSREAAPTSRTAHSARAPSYPYHVVSVPPFVTCCVHTLMWHKQAAGSGTFRRHLLRLRPSRARPSQLHISRRRASAWASPSVTIGNPPNCPPPSSSHDRAGVEQARRLCADRSASVIPMHRSRRHEPRRAQARASTNLPFPPPWLLEPL